MTKYIAEIINRLIIIRKQNKNCVNGFYLAKTYNYIKNAIKESKLGNKSGLKRSDYVMVYATKSNKEISLVTVNAF